MSKSVYNKLTDEVGGQKAPLTLHACKLGSRLTNRNWRLTQHNFLDNHNSNPHSLINNTMNIQ